MKEFQAVRLVTAVKVGKHTESFFAAEKQFAITNDGGPFVSIKHGEDEVLTPLPNVLFLVPKKAAAPGPEAKKKS
jgi:hypothetical protein